MLMEMQTIKVSLKKFQLGLRALLATELEVMFIYILAKNFVYTFFCVLRHCVRLNLKMADY